MSRTNDLTTAIDDYRRLHLIPLTLELSWDPTSCTKRARNWCCSKYADIVSEATWAKHENDVRNVAFRDSISLCCGREGRNNIVVVDVDFPKAKDDSDTVDGMKLWLSKIEQNGEPMTWKAKTQSGGWHYYFDAETPGLKRKTDTTKLAIDGKKTTIDYRGNGIIFAPPSSFERDGEINSYEWITAPWEIELAQMPPWLIDVMNAGVGEPPPDKVARPISARLHTETEGTLLSENDCTSSIVQHTKGLLRSKCKDRTSRYTGTKFCNGEAIMKFRVAGSRKCVNQKKHVSNNFGVISDGVLLMYRCLSSECLQAPRSFLGICHWPELLTRKHRFDFFVFEKAARIIARFHAEECTDPKQIRKHFDQLIRLAFETMNHYFCVIDGSSKTMFIETMNNKEETATPSKSIYRTRNEFIDRCESFNLTMGKNVENLGKLWCKSSRRKTHQRIVFKPSSGAQPCSTASDEYNLFHGFLLACKPLSPVDHDATDPLLQHMYEVLANKESNVNDYILNWLAHIIQKPEKKIGTALVFRSSQGAGKSLVTKFVEKQFIGASHYLYCNDMDKVIGKFNNFS
jgi:hypothetical protein